MRFDSTFKEVVALEDGQDLTLRVVRSTDKDLLAHGMARLSPQSRLFRFYGMRKDLSESELRYFCGNFSITPGNS